MIACTTESSVGSVSTGENPGIHFLEKKLNRKRFSAKKTAHFTKKYLTKPVNFVFVRKLL